MSRGGRSANGDSRVPGRARSGGLSIGTGAPLELSGVHGALALDPAAFVLLPAMTLPASGKLQFGVTIPGAPGAHFTLQTLQVLGNSVDLSPPTLFAVGV